MVAEGIHQEHLERGGSSSGSAGKSRVEMNCRRRSTNCLKRLGESLTNTHTQLMLPAWHGQNCTYPKIYISTKIDALSE